MEKRPASACANCRVGKRKKVCLSEEGRGPKFCPTLDREETIQAATAEYDREDVGEFARQASIQEGECYAGRETRPYVKFPVKPRVQEVCEFAHKMGFKKLGIAFKVSDETIEKYKGYKIDLEAASGHDHHLLPVPAVFLIGLDGTILWTYSDPDYTKRLNSSKLLQVAKENGKK